MGVRTRTRVDELEAKVEALENTVKQMRFQLLMLSSDVQAEKAVNEEHRKATYPSYRRGFPDGARLERFFAELEALLKEH